MTISQHLIENALIEYCTYLHEDQEAERREFDFGDFVKKQAEQCSIDLHTLLEICIYIVFNYGENIQQDTMSMMESRYGYSPEGHIETPSIYIDSYAR